MVTHSMSALFSHSELLAFDLSLIPRSFYKKVDIVHMPASYLDMLHRILLTASEALLEFFSLLLLSDRNLDADSLKHVKGFVKGLRLHATAGSTDFESNQTNIGA